MTSPLRIVFMGTAELACSSLEALAVDPGFQIIGVVTQPDRPRGRELRLQPSPVKETATRLNLPVFQPEKIRQDSALRVLTEWAPDLVVVVAYGQILPAAVLTLPRWGCLNVHASLLPKYRGAAPIQWALLNGDSESGVTIMKMDAGLDTGDILAIEKTPISNDDNAQSLHDRLATLGAGLLIATLPRYFNGHIQPQKQPPEGGLYARKITKEDGHLDWRLPAHDLWNRVRALNPWPGAYTTYRLEEKAHLLKVWRAQVAEDQAPVPGAILRAEAGELVVACGQQALRLLELQREGKRRLRAAEFLAGTPLKCGAQLA